MVRPGGIYISEDLHCSYWKEYGGGLNYDLSGLAFFKRLIDGINLSSWQSNGQSIRNAFDRFIETYQLDANLLENCVAELASVEFYDSLHPSQTTP